MPQTDHDQRLKTLLKEYFGSFFELFWPDYARQLDFSRIDWLEKEVFPDPPAGQRRELDLVAKLPLREPIQTGPGRWSRELVAIVHVEIESADSVEPLRQRMFQYFACLRQNHAEPILPVAVYLNVGLNGIDVDFYEEFFGSLPVVRYNYLYVGLPALEANEYANKDNWLGVALAALMRVAPEERARLKAELLRRVVQGPENEYRKHLLAECVQTYLRLRRPEEQQEFKRLLEEQSYGEVKHMAETWFEEGLEQGLEQGLQQGLQRGLKEGLQAGRVEGQRATVARVLEHRFGPLPAVVRSRVETCPEEAILDLIDQAYSVKSLDQVRWPREAVGPNG